MNKKEKIFYGKQRQNKNRYKTKTLLRGEINLKYHEQIQSKKHFKKHLFEVEHFQIHLFFTLVFSHLKNRF